MTRVLGLDTSCYRTSLALIEDNAIRADERILLTVPEGARGARQSESVFAHIQHIGRLTEALFAVSGKPDVVCASTRPRPVEGSYMPVFTVGENVGRAVAASLGVPFFATTHQQGHLRAALVGTTLSADRFLALHLSGGTTELLDVDSRLCCRTIGGGRDLHLGQLVDRIGVAMGLPFPAGPALEALAASGCSASRVPTSNSGLYLNLSGAETQLLRMLASGVPQADVAAELYSLAARTIAKLIDAGVRETGVRSVLLAGGVAASAHFRRLLPQRLSRLRCPAALHWAQPELSGDNAVGVALIGWSLYADGFQTK